MKLTVDTLDNEVKSAIINIGANNGYIEAYIDDSFENPQLNIYIYDSEGKIFSKEIFPVKLLKRGKK